MLYRILVETNAQERGEPIETEALVDAEDTPGAIWKARAIFPHSPVTVSPVEPEAADLDVRNANALDGLAAVLGSVLEQINDTTIVPFRYDGGLVEQLAEMDTDAIQLARRVIYRLALDARYPGSRLGGYLNNTDSPA